MAVTPKGKLTIIDTVQTKHKTTAHIQAKIVCIDEAGVKWFFFIKKSRSAIMHVIEKGESK